MVSKKKKKKKRSSPKLRLIFRPKSEIQIQTLFQECQTSESRHVLHNFGTQFSMGGGCFQFFTKNRPQKHQKRAILHTSQANGGLEPPRPPLATLLLLHLSHKLKYAQCRPNQSHSLTYTSRHTRCQ